MTEEIVVEFITRAVFEHQPNQLFRYDNLVESGDVRMEELAMVVNFTGQIGIFPRRRLEHDLQTRITSSDFLLSIMPERVYLVEMRTLEPLVSL